MANGLFYGGAGTLKSLDLPSAFVELAMITQTSERACVGISALLATNNISVPDFVSITANFNTDITTVTINNLPLSITTQADGIRINAIDYLAPINALSPTLVINTFDNTDTDLYATSKVSGLLELAQLIQMEESAKNLNRVNINFNIENKTASIVATFKGVPRVNSSGYVEVVIENYLA